MFAFIHLFYLCIFMVGTRCAVSYFVHILVIVVWTDFTLCCTACFVLVEISISAQSNNLLLLQKYLYLATWAVLQLEVNNNKSTLSNQLSLYFSLFVRFIFASTMGLWIRILHLAWYIRMQPGYFHINPAAVWTTVWSCTITLAMKS